MRALDGELVDHAPRGDLVEIGDHERGALGGEPVRVGAADAGAAAGDHHDLALEPRHGQTLDGPIRRDEGR